MSLIKLKNGSEADEGLVKAVMLNLESLWDEGMAGMLAIYDLNEICKGQGYKPFGNGLKILQDRNLLESDGRPHGLIRDIVSSAIQGEGVDLHLASPVAAPKGSAAVLPPEMLKAIKAVKKFTP